LCVKAALYALAYVPHKIVIPTKPLFGKKLASRHDRIKRPHNHQGASTKNGEQLDAAILNSVMYTFHITSPKEARLMFSVRVMWR
jgi:hypothetical protein